MKALLFKMWKEDEGVLTFEWTLLVTLLTIGVVSGLAGARDAIVDELGDVAQGMVAVDQSYSISLPLQAQVHDATVDSAASDSGFIDVAFFEDCGRVNNPINDQPGEDDAVGGP